MNSHDMHSQRREHSRFGKLPLGILLALIAFLLQACEVPIKIDSPENGAQINADTVTVTGTFTGPAHSGITVNGVVAQIVKKTMGKDKKSADREKEMGERDDKAAQGKRFYATIPLQPGSNQITVVGTTPQGQSATTRISVTRTGDAPVKVTASPAQGLGPLNVSFSIASQTGNPIQHIQADFDGDGVVDFDSADPSAPIEFVYLNPGVYQAKFTVIDTQSAYTQSVMIAVKTPDEIDQAVRAAWDGMTQALVKQDLPSALQYLSPESRDNYQPVFEALATEMRKVVRSFSALKQSQIHSEYAEYAIRSDDNGVDRLYLIYFVQDSDGVWRIASM